MCIYACFCQVEVTRLFRAMGPEFHDVVKAADELRARVNGEKVSVLSIFGEGLVLRPRPNGC